ncbi:nucleolin-like [Venturia canescens]|uniref:nucleolin-like n=1 Tax=Venturia canescens TaxID=32260 RepID=UPI001C9D32D1|nr:nucleolin-like [Venturia canescens]
MYLQLESTRKIVKALTKLMRNLSKALETADDDDDVEEEEELDTSLLDETKEFQITEDWVIDKDVFIKAASAETMPKRISVLMSVLWSEEERMKLVVKSRKSGYAEDGAREICTEELEKLRCACMRLQSTKKLPVKELDSMESMKAVVSKKLKHDRYNRYRRNANVSEKRRGIKSAANRNSNNDDEDDDAPTVTDNDDEDDDASTVITNDDQDEDEDDDAYNTGHRKSNAASEYDDSDDQKSED